jgi:electron transfer flavoprotein alpha subunit
VTPAGAVWAWAADPGLMGEAADLARELGAPAAAVAVGIEPHRLAEAGAEVVVALEAEGAEAQVAAALEPLRGARAVLFAGDAAGSAVAPRLAAGLGAACLLDVARLRARPDGIEVARWAHDDRAQERWLVPPELPLVVALRAVRGPAPVRPRPLRLLRAGAPPPRRRVLRRLPPNPGSVPLEEADRIVAAGLGVGSPQLLASVAELGRRLGAALGASRPVADRGWVPFERQIGTTGRQVSPRLYVALGISGASQHLGGLRSVETVVAINVDPACPMMARASLAAVGDVGQVVPAMLRRLEEEGP